MINSARKSVVAGRVAVAPVPGPGRAPSGQDLSQSPSQSPPGTPAGDAARAAAHTGGESPAQSGHERSSGGLQAARGAAAAPAVWPANREVAALSLERRIRAHLSRCDLSVSLTDNRYTMISVRRDQEAGIKCFKVRLHHMFADASPLITRSLARYIAHNDRDASRILGEYIDHHQHRVRTRTRRMQVPRLIASGRIHDLREIFDDLNRRYFGGGIDARITWGQRTGKPKRRNSIKMGSYSVEDRLIRIHRSLDRSFVPRFFVEWVVFHEMLHQIHDIKVVNGRRRFHSRAFLRDEARFQHYARARAWERANLDALLTY